MGKATSDDGVGAKGLSWMYIGRSVKKRGWRGSMAVVAYARQLAPNTDKATVSHSTSRHTASWAALVGFSFLVTTGCSLVVDAGREQCSDTSDCTRLGPEFARSTCVDSLCRQSSDPAWACLDEGAFLPQQNIPSEISVTARLVDVVRQSPVPGIDLRVCERLDVECLMPVAAGVSNENGEVDVALPGGFDGYLRWQSPNAQPVLFFFGAPLTRDAVIPLGVVTPQIMAGLDVQFQDITIADRAVVVVYATNCRGAAAAGVKLSVLEGDASTRIFYEVNGLFPPSQQETSETGAVRIINVPTGNVSLRARLSDGREMGAASVLTRTGFATLTVLGPGSR